mgnify:CR=1 FL=1
MAVFIDRRNLQGIKKFAFFIPRVFVALFVKRNRRRSISPDDLPRQLQKDLGLGVSPEGPGSFEGRWRQELKNMRKNTPEDRA